MTNVSFFELVLLNCIKPTIHIIAHDWYSRFQTWCWIKVYSVGTSDFLNDYLSTKLFDVKAVVAEMRWFKHVVLCFCYNDTWDRNGDPYIFELILQKKSRYGRGLTISWQWGSNLVFAWSINMEKPWWDIL